MGFYKVFIRVRKKLKRFLEVIERFPTFVFSCFNFSMRFRTSLYASSYSLFSGLKTNDWGEVTTPEESCEDPADPVSLKLDCFIFAGRAPLSIELLDWFPFKKQLSF